MILDDIDLRDCGLTSAADSLAPRTGEMALLDGSFATGGLGAGGRTWELGGEHTPDNTTGGRLWELLQSAASERRSMTLSLPLPDGTVAKIMDVYVTGQPRREWVELMNGAPVTMRWRLRLVEAST